MGGAVSIKWKSGSIAWTAFQRQFDSNQVTNVKEKKAFWPLNLLKLMPFNNTSGLKAQTSSGGDRCGVHGKPACVTTS